MGNVIEQIRLRRFAERKQQHSVALNHLLNEIQAICFYLDKRPIVEKKYKAPKVLEFLNEMKVPYIISNEIKNLFDRRNKNLVSHADSIAWLVSQAEYEDYHKAVGKCLKYIL